MTIQEKEKLYVELKNLLARQPGPEVAEQLSIYQQNLKQKTNQMKAMAAELNMYQAQVNEYKYEIERLTRELQEMKRKYYEQKRREGMQREAAAKMQPRTVQQNTGPQQRFTGGGFPLAIWAGEWPWEDEKVEGNVMRRLKEWQMQDLSHIQILASHSS